jgi:hypothetical protein
MPNQREAAAIARWFLGAPGRLLAPSKTEYRALFPTNVFLPNGNLFTETAKIWFGDLDLTLDEEAVVEIARRARKTVYVLHEHDGRVAGRERNPDLHAAVLVARGHGTVELGSRVGRDTNGLLCVAPRKTR